MRRFVQWLVVLLFAISLAGCGSSKATTTTPKKKPTKKKTQVAEKKKPAGKTKIGGVWGGMFLDEYRNQLKSGDPEQRIKGCKGLAGLGERAVDALPELKEAAASDKNQRVRAEAKKAIETIEAFEG
jgi:hypothetical protein